MGVVKKLPRIIAIGIQLLTSILIVGTVSSDVNANVDSMGEAINIAGRQRMLSQRIAQSYFLIGINPDSKRGNIQLKRAVAEFDRNLENLKRYQRAEPLQDTMAGVEALWIPYRTLATAPVSKANGKVLLDQSNQLLAMAHTYVVALEVLSGSHKGEIINISGRQRMLSQRIAKNFLASHWQLTDHVTTQLLYEDIAEYENVLSYLSQLKLNTPEIQTQLHKVTEQFRYASKGFDGVMSLSGKRLVHVVTGTTDAMLRGMNIVTGLYAQHLTE